MDKRTILIVTGVMIAMFGLQRLIDVLYPPVPKKVQPVSALSAAVTNGTNVATSAEVSPTATNTVAAAKPETATATRTPEQTVTLSNALMRVEITSWGGGVKSIELLKHRGRTVGNTELLGSAVEPALTLVDAPGASLNNIFTIEQPNLTTAILHADGVTKTLTLSSNYLIEADFEFDRTAAANLTNALINVGTAVPLNIKEPGNYLNVDWQGGPKWSNRDVSKVTKRTKSGENHEAIRAHWVAVKNQYFVMIVSTPTNFISVTYNPVILPPWPELKGKPAPVGVTAIAEVPVTRTTNGSAACTFTYYTGPKDYDQLMALGQNQEEAMDFGSWLDGYTGIFGLILLRSLNFFYGLIANYGIAIILVTVTLKVIFWPIQAKSYKSMKAMQRFQPQIAKLKEKYKDDPTKLNTETMALYKKHKINPFSGCLPMVVQLPVLYGFYRLLMCDIALRGASFLWIKDLSQPDTVATIAGFAINPLPILMAISGILQQKLTPATGDAQQAKMMMFMPLIMTLFFYNLASGLTLYYTLQQLLSVLQQWLAMRHDKNAGTVVVAGKTT